MEELLVKAAVLLAGVLAHMLKEVSELRKSEGAGFHLKHYLSAYPYVTIVMLLTAGGAFAILHEAGQLTMAAAFATGYTIDSAANLFSNRVRKIT